MDGCRCAKVVIRRSEGGAGRLRFLPRRLGPNLASGRTGTGGLLCNKRRGRARAGPRPRSKGRSGEDRSNPMRGRGAK